MHTQIIFLLHNGQPCHAASGVFASRPIKMWLNIRFTIVYAYQGSKVVCAMIRRPEDGGVIGTVDE
jgi:hypothetical protein